MRLMRWTWAVLCRVASPGSRALSLTGPLVLVFTTLVWVVFMWAGWTLVFASTDATLIDTLLLETGDPLVEAFEASGDGDAVVVLERPPTAEVMGVVLERRLLEALPDTVSDVAVAVRETNELRAGGVR